MAIVPLEVSSVPVFVSQALSRQDKQIAGLKTEQANLSSVRSQYSAMSGMLAALRAAARAMTVETNLLPEKATSSDPGVAEAAVGPGAVPSTYKISVASIADAHTIASAAWKDDGSELGATEGTGTAHIRLDSQGARKKITVELSKSDANLQVLQKTADAINAGAPDVIASIIHEVPGTSTLVVQSRGSGEVSRMGWSDGYGDLLETMGLVDENGGALRTLAAGNDAHATVNGIMQLTSSSNDFSKSMPGLTLTVRKPGTATLSVARDVSGAAAKVQAFIEAYNGAIDKLRAAVEQEPVPGQPQTGLLYRDQLLSQIMNALKREVLTAPAAGKPGLAELGVSPVNSLKDSSVNGHLQIDSTVLTKQISSSPMAVLSVFADADDGVARRLAQTVDQFSEGSSGALPLKMTALTARSERLAGLIKGAMNIRAQRSEGLSRRYEDMVVSQEKQTNRMAFIQSQGGGVPAISKTA